MSNAVYCDHCEKLISKKHSKQVEMKLHRTKQYSPEKHEMDLCHECFEQLDSWIFARLNVETEEDDKD